MEVVVNDRIITEPEIARETQYHPAGSLEDARRQAAIALVVRELLLQQASRLGLAEAAGMPDESRISALIAREVRVPEADEATCRRYYETHLSRFRSPDLIEARHILFAAPPDDTAVLAVARNQAVRAIKILQGRPDRFPELAKELSACPSAKEGGNLGQLSRGSTVREVETFLFELEEGQLCPVPIPSRYGFHVLRVERRVLGKTLPFEMVQQRIVDYLEQRVWRQAVRQYIQLLVGSADIRGINLPGSASPLVQ
jgi:peptidyl-prolyl cis-trans isomerase C